MIICIEYDNDKITRYTAFRLVEMAGDAYICEQDEIKIVRYDGVTYKVTLVTSKLVEESYTIEQVA